MIETGFMFALGVFLFIIFLYLLPIIIPVCILAAIGLFIYASVDEDSVKKEYREIAMDISKAKQNCINRPKEDCMDKMRSRGLDLQIFWNKKSK